jgi:hypothetical protein
MQHNFFVDDPDAFNVTDSYLLEDRRAQAPVSLSGAQASIALSAVSGGMYEIGDDLLTLGSEKDRLALVENPDLLNMSKVGRASKPIDLMTYEPEDEQPSIFFLQESPRQAILTVFNWTKNSRSHTLKLVDLGLPAGHAYTAVDVLDPSAQVALAGDTVRIENQPAESVRVIKFIDGNVSASAPTVQAQVPSVANAGATIHLSAQAEPGGVPAIGYHWDFGDGNSADGARVTYTYTRATHFDIRLTVNGVDGVPAVQTFPVEVTGSLHALPKLTDNRRFKDPSQH